MRTLDKMMLEIYEKSEHWRFYVENSKFKANNQYEDLVSTGETLEDVINKVWLHYYGSKAYRITTTYFTGKEGQEHGAAE